MNFSALLSSLSKTSIVVLTGTVVPLILTAIDHPTGGLAGYLAANPQVATIYALGAYFVHNYLSNIQTVPVNQVVPVQAKTIASNVIHIPSTPFVATVVAPVVPVVVPKV